MPEVTSQSVNLGAAITLRGSTNNYVMSLGYCMVPIESPYIVFTHLKISRVKNSVVKHFLNLDHKRFFLIPIDILWHTLREIQA